LVSRAADDCDAESDDYTDKDGEKGDFERYPEAVEQIEITVAFDKVDVERLLDFSGYRVGCNSNFILVL
jgi:hypothetical protein